MKTCPKCSNNHNKTGTFCSRSCANSREFSKESKLKKSISAKTSEKVLLANIKQTKEKIQKLCTYCTKEFLVHTCKMDQKTCSKECSYKQISLDTKGVTGGYREGSGRSHSGYYNKIFCGSTYELLWVMYNINHGISFKRYDGYITYGKDRKYYPDFLQDDCIIEIKGYHTLNVDLKTKACTEQCLNIKILYKKDLEYVFKWFKETYPNKKPQEFYEDYKPKYEYTCKTCLKLFNTDSKRKTEVVFCSKSCIRKGPDQLDDEIKNKRVY